MKILILTHFYKPEIGAGSIRVQYLTKSLRAANHQVKIVTPVPNYPFGKTYSSFTNKLIVNEKESIVYLPIYLPQHQSVFSRGISYLSFFFRSFFYSIFNEYKPELVITSSPPIITALSAILISKIKRIPIIVDLRDIWPDIGFELGLIRNKTIFRILRVIESFILKNASILVVTAEGDRKNLISKNVEARKIFVIYNGADTNLYTPIDETERKKIRISYNLPLDKKLLIYFGSFNYGMNDIESMGNALRSAEKWSEKFNLIIVGYGENFDRFIHILDNKIKYIHFKSMTSEELAKIVAASDLSLIPRKKLKNNTGGNIPVKCFESWAAGIPVIISADHDSEIKRIFSECPSGFFVESENIEAFSSTLINFLESDFDEQKKMSARKYVVDNFNRSAQSEILNSIIEKQFIKKNST
jgi:glycosyltransferase involved in cell wall biosynthesis